MRIIVNKTKFSYFFGISELERVHSSVTAELYFSKKLNSVDIVVFFIVQFQTNCNQQYKYDSYFFLM